MPVAESELVAGYNVEYTGFRFLFFFIGEFGTAFAFSALAATLFPRRLVGSVGPRRRRRLARAARAVRDGDVRQLLDVLGSLHLPPIARGSAQALAWKWLIPIALVNILATGVLKVAFG